MPESTTVERPLTDERNSDAKILLFLWLPFIFLILHAVASHILYAIDIETICYRVEPGSSETVCGVGGGYASPFITAIDFLIFGSYPFAVFAALNTIFRGWRTRRVITTALNILGFSLSSLSVAMLAWFMQFVS